MFDTRGAAQSVTLRGPQGLALLWWKRFPFCFFFVEITVVTLHFSISLSFLAILPF